METFRTFRRSQSFLKDECVLDAVENGGCGSWGPDPEGEGGSETIVACAEEEEIRPVLRNRRISVCFVSTRSSFGRNDSDEISAAVESFVDDFGRSRSDGRSTLTVER